MSNSDCQKVYENDNIDLYTQEYVLSHFLL